MDHSDWLAERECQGLERFRTPEIKRKRKGRGNKSRKMVLRLKGEYVVVAEYGRKVGEL